MERSVLQQAVDAFARYGSKSTAAEALGVPLTTFKDRLRKAANKGLKAEQPRDAQLEAQVKFLAAELATAKKDALTHERIRSEIIRLSADVATLRPLPWLSPVRSIADAPGVPTLFLSDFHWGEVVAPSQINGVNEFNLKIAHQRLRDTVDIAEHLLRILEPKMRYPGIVAALGGDMVTGNIHEELQATNEVSIMPTVLDLFGALAKALRRLADVFGKVFVPCVGGNHGRATLKTWSKDRNFTSFDWLLYSFLAKHFEDDPRITFYIPDGPDAYYRIFGTRYLLTHGDQFRGGDGMIGALGPIIRGDHKKRSRNAQIDMDYDVMMLGHWHQYIHHSRVIVNGSLKGYDEYAYQGNFGFEAPQQALWITHPKYGITYRMPVRADRLREPAKTEWVSFPKAA